jgi:transcriptional regulator with XRE-family HTH domain
MSTERKHRDHVEAGKFLDALLGPLTFGSMLRTIRVTDELGQPELAEKLSISKSHLCDIEKGRKLVSAARAAEFARILGYPVEQFVRQALEDELAQGGLHFKVALQKQRRPRHRKAA